MVLTLKRLALLPAAGLLCAYAGDSAQVSSAALPRPRAGLWEVLIRMTDLPPLTRQYCLTGESLAPAPAPGCDGYSYSRTAGGAFTINYNCMSSGVRQTVHETFSGDFQTQFFSERSLKSTAPGAAQPYSMRDQRFRRYLGPCPAGTKAFPN